MGSVLGLKETFCSRTICSHLETITEKLCYITSIYHILVVTVAEGDPAQKLHMHTSVEVLGFRRSIAIWAQRCSVAILDQGRYSTENKARKCRLDLDQLIV